MGGKVGSRSKPSPDIRKLGVEHRLKIANSNVLNRLIAHAEGSEEDEMSQSQVTAAIALVRKILPDLTYSESDNTHNIKGPTEIIIRGYDPTRDS